MNNKKISKTKNHKKASVRNEKKACEHEHEEDDEEDDKINIMSRDDQWLEKYNRLNDFFQKHDHTKVPYARITDNSLYHWV